MCHWTPSHKNQDNMLNHFQTKSAPLTIALAGALVIAGFAFRTDDPLAPVTVSKSYHRDDFGSIDAQGACTVTADTVSCWNMDGKSDPDLTEKVKAYYLIQPNTDLHFKFGRKNRLVAFKRPAQGYMSNGYLTNAATLSGSYINFAGQIGANGNTREPYLEWYAMDADPADATTSIVFNINLPLGSGQVPLKAGAEGQVGTMKVHINGIKSAPEQTYWNGTSNQKQKQWAVSVTITGSPSSSVPSLLGRVLGSKGTNISRVDANGIPLPEPSRRNGGFNGYQSQSGFDAGIQVDDGAGTANQELTLPVNPANASALSLSFTGVRKVTITGIPLDPK